MKMRWLARFFASILALSAFYGCGDETSASGGSDCRQEAFRCIDGLTCVEHEGGWECLPVRDARVDDEGVAADAEAESEAGSIPPPADAGVPVDATSPSVDMMMAVQDMAVPVDDAAPSAGDMTVPLQDMGVPIEDAQPVADMAPPMEDMAPPPVFGPGRCNHQRRLDEDDQYEPNPDQNSARPLRVGRHDNLILRAGDSDWYRVEGLCDGGILEINLSHPFDGGDLDLQVWADGGDRVIHSQEFCAGQEGGRYDIEDGVDWVNIGVYPFGPPGEPGGANTYSLEIRLACP